LRLIVRAQAVNEDGRSWVAVRIGLRLVHARGVSPCDKRA
jgi:hypothetical protein